jgi:hypothetical protein
MAKQCQNPMLNTGHTPSPSTSCPRLLTGRRQVVTLFWDDHPAPSFLGDGHLGSPSVWNSGRCLTVSAAGYKIPRVGGWMLTLECSAPSHVWFLPSHFVNERAMSLHDYFGQGGGGIEGLASVRVVAMNRDRAEHTGAARSVSAARASVGTTDVPLSRSNPGSYFRSTMAVLMPCSSGRVLPLRGNCRRLRPRRCRGCQRLRMI